MKNHVQPGNTITLTAPYAVASGDGLLVGAIFGIAAGTPPPGARIMHTEERPAFLAKNRCGLPDTLPLMWSEFLAAMPQSQ